MEYKIYKKINSDTVREHIGCCFVTNPDTEMDIEQIRKDLEHHGQEISSEASLSSAKFVYVEDDDKEFEFIPVF